MPEPGIDIAYVRNKEKVEIDIVYGDVRVHIVSTSEEGGLQLATLAHNLPALLHQVYIQTSETTDGKDPIPDE